MTTFFCPARLPANTHAHVAYTHKYLHPVLNWRIITLIAESFEVLCVIVVFISRSATFYVIPSSTS